MFKCTECEKIYDIKPDYCDDCGNDVFEEITQTAPAPERTEIKEEKITKEVNEEPKTIIEDIKPSFKKSEKPKKEIDYLSVGFLAICILISLYIIFFAWNPKEEDIIAQGPQNNEQKEAKQKTNIPSSVDSFWNNELPKVQPKPVIKAPVQEIQPQRIEVVVQQPQQIQQVKPQPVQQVKPQEVKKQAPTVQKPVQQVQKPTQTVQKQTQTKPKTVQQVQKPTQTKPASTTQTVTKAQTQKQTTTKPAQTSTQPVWQSVQQPQAQPVQKPAQTVDTSALKKELATYKINLRNTIGRKIDFANVIGDGSCAISFKISSDGRIIKSEKCKEGI